MSLSEDGYIFWTRGTMWFSLAQFRDNVLLATNLPPGTRTTLVQEVCDLLSEFGNSRCCATAWMEVPHHVTGTA